PLLGRPRPPLLGAGGLGLGGKGAGVRVVNAEDVVLVQHLVGEHLEHVLHQEPEQRVHPHKEDDGAPDGVHGPEGPRVGEDGGHAQREGTGAEQRQARGLLPEEAVRARAEQRQEAAERAVEVHGRHALLVVQVDAHAAHEGVAVDGVQAQGQKPQRGAAGDGAQHGGDGVEHLQVPHVRALRVLHAVVGDGDDGAVVQQRDDDQRQHGHAPEVVVAGVVVHGVDQEHREEEEHQQHERAGHAVDHEGPHAREDHARDLDGLHDGHEPLLGQHQVGGGAGRVRGARHRDADVRLLERGRVVDAVARHAAHEPLAAQRLHEDELVLGEHLREAVALDDLRRDLVHVVGQLAVGPHVRQALAAQDVVPHAQLPRGLARDGRVVARDHLHLHA
ncbi:unnamed protein product, partial [Heterosigma akashiwo]